MKHSKTTSARVPRASPPSPPENADARKDSTSGGAPSMTSGAKPTSASRLNGMELDAKMRDILNSVTPETCLSAMREMVDLGFGGRASFNIIMTVLEKKHEML